MARKSRRKLFLFGRYSLALLLPKKWLTELGVKRGAEIGLEFDRSRQRIVLRFDQTDIPPKKTVSTPKTIKTTPPELPNDLQPIPEL